MTHVGGRASKIYIKVLVRVRVVKYDIGTFSRLFYRHKGAVLATDLKLRSQAYGLALDKIFYPARVFDFI